MVPHITQIQVWTVREENRECLLASGVGKVADAELMAAAHNALPRLFAEIDELRAKTRGVPVLGTVG
jgi:hypothetical protein